MFFVFCCRLVLLYVVLACYLLDGECVALGVRAENVIRHYISLQNNIKKIRYDYSILFLFCNCEYFLFFRGAGVYCDSLLLRKSRKKRCEKTVGNKVVAAAPLPWIIG